MRILHYIPSINESSGGVGAYMQLLASGLGKLVDLHIVTHKRDNERVLDNCTIHYLPYKWLPWDSCKEEFLQLLNELQPEVFHTNSCWMPLSALTAIWAKQVGYKVVYTPHGMLVPWSMKYHAWKKIPAKWLFQHKGIAISDVIHATAESEKKNLLDLGWNNNIQVIANCIRLEEVDLKQSWSRKKNILFLGRVHEVKGVNFLVEAIAHLKDELAEYTITIAGPSEGNYVNELKKTAQNLGVLGMIQFIGPIYGEKKWSLYRNADLLVLPSFTENFGIVVPEALASGTPVITTKGTPWEELNQYKCGWWVDIGTQPLVNALQEFLSCSEADLKAMGVSGRKLVEKNYTSQSVAAEFLKMYEDLTNP